MTSPTSETQKAVAAVLLADAGVTAIAATTPDGKAVFARGQRFEDRYPRVTLRPPQRIDQTTGCGDSADMIVTLDVWAKGPDASLVAGELADAVIEALKAPLAMTGWKVSSRSLLASRPVGDPDPTIEHFVVEHRFTVHRTA
jgi:hypothetical protein